MIVSIASLKASVETLRHHWRYHPWLDPGPFSHCHTRSEHSSSSAYIVACPPQWWEIAIRTSPTATKTSHPSGSSNVSKCRSKGSENNASKIFKKRLLQWHLPEKCSGISKRRWMHKLDMKSKSLGSILLQNNDRRGAVFIFWLRDLKCCHCACHWELSVWTCQWSTHVEGFESDSRINKSDSFSLTPLSR